MFSEKWSLTNIELIVLCTVQTVVVLVLVLLQSKSRAKIQFKNSLTEWAKIQFYLFSVLEERKRRNWIKTAYSASAAINIAKEWCNLGSRCEKIKFLDKFSSKYFLEWKNDKKKNEFHQWQCSRLMNLLLLV